MIPGSLRRIVPRPLRLRASAFLAERRSQRIQRELAAMVASGQPIVAGPWLGEVGFELLYWAPFLAWVAGRFGVPPDRLFVVYARCTHLGCTPDWKPSENKFKCPCHGSGYDSEAINFEGPAPRPMDRAQVELDAEGQIVVNINKLYKWEKGVPAPGEFDQPGAYIPLG